MRTEQQVYDLFLNYARSDRAVRLVTLEGSRTNPAIASDQYQDFDISYFVPELKPYQVSDQWLDGFGPRLILQKPEDMLLFPAELNGWFSYLMIFADGIKVDLTVIPLHDIDLYFNDNDGLVKILLDKDQRIQKELIPSDQSYWIQPPSAREFDDCCNEFWMLATYVAKGLARHEILFANDHLHGIMRPNLLRMMAWQIGVEYGYCFSLGKNYKFIDRYLPAEHWEKLLASYTLSNYRQVWQALKICLALFRVYSRTVAQHFDYQYPDYDAAITGYIEQFFEKGINHSIQTDPN